MSMTPAEGLHKGIASLYASKKYTDLTVKCGSHEFKVHRAIVCPQSDFFEAACKGNFQEGATGVIKLDSSDDPASDDPEAIKQMIYFFYHLDYTVNHIFSWMTGGTYPEKTGRAKRQRLSSGYAPATPVKPTEASNESDMLAHAKVFAAAVKHNVIPLRVIAATKFKTAVQANSTHPKFADAIGAVYSSTSDDARELRDIVEETLAKDKSFLDRKEIEEAVRDADGPAFALLRKTMKEVRPAKNAAGKQARLGQCSQCKKDGGYCSANIWYCFSCKRYC